MRFKPGVAQPAGNAAPGPDEQHSQALFSGAAWEGLGERYGLRTSPLVDGPGRFFEGGDRQHCLESLRHLCSFGDMFLVLSGSPGSVRSRLLEQLRLQGKPHLQFQTLKPEDCVSVYQLAQALWSSLRQAAPPSCSPLQAIERFFQSTHWQTTSAKRWVLLIDDADTVPVGVLEALALGFSRSDRTRVPVPLIVGTDGLVGKFQRQGEDSPQWLHQIAVRPVSEEESGQFIERCFEGAGADGTELPGRLQLYLRSDGGLRRLKQIASQTIPSAPLTGRDPVVKRRSGDKTPRQTALWLIPALALLGASYALVSWQYGTSPGAVAALGASERIDEVERLRLAMAEAEKGMRYLSDEPVIEGGSLATEKISAGHEAAVQPGNPSLLLEAAGLPESEGLAIELAGPAPGSDAPSAEPQPGVPDPATTTESVADLGAVSPISGFEPRLADRFRDRTWIDQLAPGTLVIQLLATYSENTAVRLVKAHPEIGLIYVRSAFRGRQSFMVLYGIYDDRTSARAAIADLPESLRLIEPWVRVADGL